MISKEDNHCQKYVLDQVATEGLLITHGLIGLGTGSRWRIDGVYSPKQHMFHKLIHLDTAKPTTQRLRPQEAW